MTAKKNQDQAAAPEPEQREAATAEREQHEATQAEREQQALHERNEALVAETRSAIERADLDEATRIQVGSQPTSPLPSPEGALIDAATRAAVEAARSEAGRPYRAPLDAEAEAARADADRGRDRVAVVQAGRDPLVALRDALSADPDDYERVDDALIAPGETERGWSPEVTARHPALIAQTLAELGGSEPKRAARLEGIDPTDRLALEDAVRENGFHDVRRRDLVNKAIRLNAERLAAADELRSQSGQHAAAAMDDALETTREAARSLGQ